MGNDFLKHLVILYFFFSAYLGDESPDQCGTGTFKLTLLGRKQANNQWNTTYNLKGSSCNTTENWNLVLYQNITEIGKVQQIHLHGYFTDNVNTTQDTVSQLIPFNQVGEGALAINNDIFETSSLCRGLKLDKEQKLKIVSRFEWNARSPTKQLARFGGPAKKLYIGYISPTCWNPEECVLWMRNVQEQNIPSAGDMSYNFYVGADGRVYEGLGWDRKTDDELNLFYIRNRTDNVSKLQLKSMVLLLREGHRIGKINTEYALRGSRSNETMKMLIESID